MFKTSASGLSLFFAGLLLGVCVWSVRAAEDAPVTGADFADPVAVEVQAGDPAPDKNAAPVAPSASKAEEGEVVEAAVENAKAKKDEAKPVEAAGQKPAATAADETPAAGADKPAAGGQAQQEQKGAAAAVPAVAAPTAEQVQKREADAKKYQGLAERALKFPITGSLNTRYRKRLDNRDNHDQDVSSYLSLDVGDKDRQLAVGHTDMRVSSDLDHQRKGLESDIFAGLINTYDDSVNYRLYSAYVDFGKIPGIDLLRAGRQWVYDTPEVLQFDGVRLDTQTFCGRHDLQFSVYGGVPVHLDEPSRKSDWLAGFAAQGKPWESARLRLDYTHITDDFSSMIVPSEDTVVKSLNTTGGSASSELVALSMWQTFQNPNINLFGRFESLDGAARELQTRCVYLKPEWELQMSLDYRVLFEREQHQVIEFDPFTPTLQGRDPYHTVNFVATKQWADHYRVEGGVMTRRLAGDTREGVFNHGFDRYFTTFGVNDLPVKGLSFNLTGYWYDGQANAANIGAIGGDVSYKWNKELNTTMGTDYQMYKYDLFQNDEIERVRTYYFKQRWRPTRWATLDVGYDFEQSVTRQFHTATATFRFSF